MPTLNTQPPEKVSALRSLVSVHSIFYTIQGEGPFAGQPAVFVRLAGCNLQCPFCDTEYTLNRRNLLPSEIVQEVIELLIDNRSDLVVITGGEPFRQNLLPLVQTLIEHGLTVQIETNGTLYQELPWHAVTIVCSPKTGSINKRLVPHILALKYVLDADSVAEDGLPILALGHPNSGLLARPPVGFSGKIYLQPVDDHSEDGFANATPYSSNRHLKACIDSCMTHGYILSLQLHKVIALE